MADPDADSGSAQLQRLKNVVRDAGGPSEVARRSGIPLGSLNHYLAGREMKISALVALADACRVSIEWLAAGREQSMAQSQTMASCPGFTAKSLSETAHFWGLFVLLRSCQEDHIKMNLVPTLAEVFEWIAPNYEKAKLLPDMRIDFKSPDETAA